MQRITPYKYSSIFYLCFAHSFIGICIIKYLFCQFLVEFAINCDPFLRAVLLKTAFHLTQFLGFKFFLSIICLFFAYFTQFFMLALSSIKRLLLVTHLYLIDTIRQLEPPALLHWQRSVILDVVVVVLAVGNCAPQLL